MKKCQIKAYFEKEYNLAKDILERKPAWLSSPAEVVQNTIQRCLGVATFAQSFVDFSTVEELYEPTRIKLLQLLEREIK